MVSACGCEKGPENRFVGIGIGIGIRNRLSKRPIPIPIGIPIPNQSQCAPGFFGDPWKQSGAGRKGAHYVVLPIPV
jgi:hypothetical protein